MGSRSAPLRQRKLPPNPCRSAMALEQENHSNSMALSSNKTSESTMESKMPPSEAEANGKASETTLRPSSYFEAQQSQHYQIAKVFLNDGDFENALLTLEEGIDLNKQILEAAGMDSNLHESMAPFHYLYGSTLLYSLEESSSSDPMTTMMSTIDVPEAASASGGSEDNGTAPAQPSEDALEDEEIAWENLDAARAIMETMLVTSMPEDLKNKISLDLAQVHLREGDLQKMNGRYAEAIQDYQACLRLRQESQLVPPYDRRIADAHYNLGLVYSLQVAETTKDADEAVMATLHDQLDQLRAKSAEHFYWSGKVFCGRMAELCSTSPEDLFAKAEEDVPKFKSTGEDEETSTEHPKVLSLKLQHLRKCVAELQPPIESKELFDEFKELLVEIQETIDEARAAEEGVHEVTAMKAQIAAAVASQVADDGERVEDGSLSTMTPNVFGSEAAAAQSAAAQPLLVVKKKQKRDATELGDSAPAAKRPPPSNE